MSPRSKDAMHTSKGNKGSEKSEQRMLPAAIRRIPCVSQTQQPPSATSMPEHSEDGQQQEPMRPEQEVHAGDTVSPTLEDDARENVIGTTDVDAAGPAEDARGAATGIEDPSDVPADQGTTVQRPACPRQDAIEGSINLMIHMINEYRQPTVVANAGIRARAAALMQHLGTLSMIPTATATTPNAVPCMPADANAFAAAVAKSAGGDPQLPSDVNKYATVPCGHHYTARHGLGVTRMYAGGNDNAAVQ